MIVEFKRADGRGLGFEKVGEKVGESSGESVYEKCVESTPEFEVIGEQVCMSSRTKKVSEQM
jgi:hypothetical protein